MCDGPGSTESGSHWVRMLKWRLMLGHVAAWMVMRRAHSCIRMTLGFTKSVLKLKPELWAVMFPTGKNCYANSNPPFTRWFSCLPELCEKYEYLTGKINKQTDKYTKDEITKIGEFLFNQRVVNASYTVSSSHLKSKTRLSVAYKDIAHLML